ncbi:uncharacterized protein LOC110984084 [Acanthaster planci]|uniref:Uncharacterized protein LOC110984084 n=1 Tax=Acanthaster planci TaxID=133434 RepID=A0A8B7Z1W1_ACAPL|nr:uncharacterized protein LOC110984084 [Acanthaster planci]
MAIMQRCCCFDNVRSGSTASGIYSMIYALISLGYGGWQIWEYNQYGLSQTNVAFIVNCFDLALMCLVFFSSILLLVGVSTDKRGYLIPYMIAMPIVVLMQCVSLVLFIIILVHPSYYVNTYAYGFGIALLVFFTLMDGICFLCVVSQYQELRDGRGRIEDVLAARRHTTFISTTAPTVGGTAVIVTQQGSAPLQGYGGYTPQQGYPSHQGCPPQPGYPPQVGYSPAAQQGYPHSPPQGVESPPAYSEKEMPYNP